MYKYNVINHYHEWIKNVEIERDKKDILKGEMEKLVGMWNDIGTGEPFPNYGYVTNKICEKNNWDLGLPKNVKTKIGWDKLYTIGRNYTC